MGNSPRNQNYCIHVNLMLTSIYSFHGTCCFQVQVWMADIMYTQQSILSSYTEEKKSFKLISTILVIISHKMMPFFSILPTVMRLHLFIIYAIYHEVSECFLMKLLYFCVIWISLICVDFAWDNMMDVKIRNTKMKFDTSYICVWKCNVLPRSDPTAFPITDRTGNLMDLESQLIFILIRLN